MCILRRALSATGLGLISIGVCTTSFSPGAVAIESLPNPAHSTIVVAAAPEDIDIDGQSVRTIAFSPNGKLLVAGGHDETLRIWDTETCQLLKAFRLKWVGPTELWHPSDVMAVAFSPDGHWLAAGSRDWAVHIFEITPSLVAKLMTNIVASQAGGIRAVAYSTDGSYLTAGGHDGLIRLWKNGNSFTEVGTLKGHSGGYGVNALVFGTRQRNLLVSAGGDGFVKLWDVQSMAEKARLHAEQEVLAVAISPDEKFIAAAATGFELDKSHIFVWETDSQRLVQKLRTREAQWAISFSRDGKLLAANGDDRSTYLWELPSGSRKQSFESEASGNLRAVVFSSDGKSLVTGGDRHPPHLWDLESKTLRKVFRASGCTP